MHWLLHYLGLDSPSGWTYLAWSGVVGSGLLGGLGAHFHRKLSRHHKAVTEQAERHHLERLAQATAHHNALLKLHGRHHDQRMNQAQAHHDALKAHIRSQPAIVASETGETHGTHLQPG